MRGRSLWRIGVLVATAALTRCMGTPIDEASAGVGYADFVPAAKRALCELMARCGKNQPDVDTCMAWNLGRLTLDGDPSGIDIECAADDVAYGQVIVDPGEAQRCLAAIQAMPCGSPHYDLFALEGLTKEACSSVFGGRVSLGGECRWLHRDCAPGLECAGCIGTDCKGSCQVRRTQPPPAHMGEPCWVCDDVHCGRAACIDGWCDEFNGYVCAPKFPDGSQCPGSREAACLGGGCWNMMMGCFTPPSQAGASCPLPGPSGCLGPLWCDGSTMTCVPYPGAAEKCSAAGPPCAGRGSCVDGTCRFVPSGGGLGASCSWSATMPPDVQYSNSCDGTLDCEMGICVARNAQCW
jgi:hypothetical protein